MKIVETSLPGVVVIEPVVFGDSRGYFMESYHRQRYAEAGIAPDGFVQDNISQSRHGVLRGLHFQNPGSQGKLIYVLEGDVFDVAVDIRQGSPTFAKWTGERLSSVNKRQLYIPPGFAHGFAVLSETALFVYKCTTFYDPRAESGIAWNDTSIGIQWPIDSPMLSDKDRAMPTLSKIDKKHLPVFDASTIS